MHGMAQSDVLDEGQRQAMPQRNVAALKEWLALRRLANPPAKRLGIGLEVVISDGCVNSSNYIIIPAPDGFREPKIKDICFLWRTSKEFREKLKKLGGIWTREFGVTYDGGYGIAEDGSTLKAATTGDFVLHLEDYERAWFFSGDGMVSVSYVKDRRTAELGVLGIQAQGPNVLERIAYVKDLDEAEARRPAEVTEVSFPNYPKAKALFQRRIVA